jgi:hypothetical protein
VGVHPCQTTSGRTFAIRRKSAPAASEVGPGRYADPDPGCSSCLVRLDKAIRLLSRDGASSTILDAAGVVAGVSIEASGAALGRKGKASPAWLAHTRGSGGRSAGPGEARSREAEVLAGGIAELAARAR